MPNSAILAGPILRRTTKNRICVWLALNNKIDLKLEILDTTERKPPQKVGDRRQGISELEEIDRCRFQLGKGLCVYLLQAYPLDKQKLFPTEKHLYYRFIDSSDKPLFDLQAALLIYDDHPYPLFHLPIELKSVLHGSCRKPHGSSGEDILAVGDFLLEDSSKHNALGPDVLLLTGDQIYADDVDATLLDLLRIQAPNLTGYSETLPGVSIQDSAPVQPAAIKLDGRADKINQAGFSSDAAGNHLMSFGEFAAMYIYAFGNAPGWRHQIVENASAKAVSEFGETLSKVRRMLANIPTFMIFDDHDVTDDWNITGQWYDKVRSSPLGRRIVSNALAAYWAFQGWGNDPENFDDDMIRAIVNHVNKEKPTIEEGELYDLTTWKHRGWGFSIATNPPVIAIDSRTQRQPDNAYYPPRLLDRYALDWLRLEWSKLINRLQINIDTCPIIIATTPVLGFSPVENVTQAALWTLGSIEDLLLVKKAESLLDKKGFLTDSFVNFADAEAWTTNLDGFTDFLDTLLHKMGLQKCLFLSGDVHYSFSTNGFYSSAGQDGKTRQLKCCQLTSSSLRNKPNERQRNELNILQNLVDPKTTKSNWWQLYGRRWQLEHSFISATNSQRIVEFCNLGQVEFDKGLPVSHKLWISQNNSVEFALPKF